MLSDRRHLLSQDDHYYTPFKIKWIINVLRRIHIINRVVYALVLSCAQTNSRNINSVQCRVGKKPKRYNNDYIIRKWNVLGAETTSEE